MKRLPFKILVSLIALILSFLQAILPSDVKADHEHQGPIQIGLALSGGGVRAAAFAYGVMLELSTICLNLEETDNPNIFYKVENVIKRDLVEDPHKKQGLDLCSHSQRSLLESLKYISTVSGGGITASYYMTHKDEDFRKNFRDLLVNRDIGKDIVFKTKARSALFGGFPLSPFLLVTSAIDTVKDIVLLPSLFDFLPNPGLTSGLFLTDAQGLIETEDLAEVYEDWLFDGKKVTFGELKNNFIKRDLKHPTSLAIRVQGGSDPASKYLKDRLKPSLKQQLIDYDGSLPLPESLQNGLIDVLNQALHDTSFYNEKQFHSENLKKETLKLINDVIENPMDEYLILKRNNNLLEDFYPDEIQKDILLPQTRDKTELLINATDITNKRIFTFDQRNFGCMGVSKHDYYNFGITKALAISSSLPVLFSPYNFKPYLKEHSSPNNVLKDCPPILWDKMRVPELHDGGIKANLGLASLVKKVFFQKSPQDSINDKEEHDSFEHTELKTFIIVVNAAAPSASSLPSLTNEFSEFSIGENSTMAQNIDQSLDTLMREKTDLSRTIFREPLNNFGYGYLEFKFSDVVEDSPILKRITQLKLRYSSKHPFSEEFADHYFEQISRYEEMEDKVRDDLNSLGMRPDKDQIDTIIAAGRAVVQNRFEKLRKDLLRLSKKGYMDQCAQILNPTLAYCWPESFQTKDLLELPLRKILQTFSSTTERFLKRTTENRLRHFQEIRKNEVEIKNEQNKAHLLQPADLDVGIKMDKDMAFILGDNTKAKALRKLLKQYDGIFTKNHSKGYQSPMIPLLGKFDINTDFVIPNLNFILNGRRIKTCLDTFKDDDKDPINIFCQKALRELATLEVLEKFETEGKKSSERKKDHKTPFFSKTSWHYWMKARQNYLLGRVDQALHFLYLGLHEHPFAIHLHSQLGHILITTDGNFKGGLRHLQKAADIAHQNTERLKAALNQETYLPQESMTIYNVINHYSKLESTYKRQYASLSPLSPTPVYQIVHQKDIYDWLVEKFPDGSGGTRVQNKYLPSNPIQKIEELLHILDTVGAQHKHQGRKYTASYYKGIFPDSFKDRLIFDEPNPPEDLFNKWLTELEPVEFNEIIDGIIKKIFEASSQKVRGQTRGFEYSDEFYANFLIKKPEFSRDAPAYPYEILDIYGLHLLQESSPLECLKRKEPIELAIQLFQKSRKSWFLQFHENFGKKIDLKSDGGKYPSINSTIQRIFPHLDEKVRFDSRDKQIEFINTWKEDFKGEEIPFPYNKPDFLVYEIIDLLYDLMLIDSHTWFANELRCSPLIEDTFQN